eukprot:CAMPEP_0194091638 /NCGR_PEP_ID=MMETSP0149-20130528/43819_1 /TAXON_ID=122233 /ORGANISM="Chaetoceros debilis, Strain MM31A-1" /LENGTH=464 /DNA_ID=CAMNT_0038776291 /DNA_START=61 /DNA_END=1455 /DNA_ORIENTATION=+
MKATNNKNTHPMTIRMVPCLALVLLQLLIAEETTAFSLSSSTKYNLRLNQIVSNRVERPARVNDMCLYSTSGEERGDSSHKSSLNVIAENETDGHEALDLDLSTANSRRDFMKNMLITSTTAAAVLTYQSSSSSENSIINTNANAEDGGMYGEEISIQNLSNKEKTEVEKQVQGGGLDWRYFAAGGTCASFSHGVATPFDVVKTKMQAEPDVYNSGLKDTISALIEKDGPGVLLQGLVPTVVGFGLEGAVKFGVYEALKPLFMSLFHVPVDDKFVPFLAASVGAGAVASLMLVPMERARINIVTGNTEGEDIGVLGGIVPMVKKEGISSVFFGYFTMLFKQVPYTVTKQVSFELLQTNIYALAIVSLAANEQTRLITTISAAFLASILACTASQPGDVILTKRFKENSRDSIPVIISTVYEDKGPGGFYAGYSARLGHVAAIVTSQLVVYDYLKQLLGLPVAGH